MGKGKKGFIKNYTWNRSSDLHVCFREFYNDAFRLRKILPGYEEFQPRQIARMTHLEMFSYPVWESKGGAEWKMEKLAEQRMVLFDYRKRSPLTNEAEVRVVEDA